MKLLDPKQFAGGPFGILLAFFTAYLVMTIVIWRSHEDIDVAEFHQGKHQSLVQYIGSQGAYLKHVFEQVYK